MRCMVECGKGCVEKGEAKVSKKVRVSRHAGLGRPAGHADTPLDDQQAMLILPWTTSRPCWDSMLFYAIFRA